MATKPKSTTASESTENSKKSISQFFRPQSKPLVHSGVNRLGGKENTDNVVVLDNDSDDDLDDNDVDIVDLTEGLKPKKYQGEERQTVRGESDKKQNPLSTQSCAEDVVLEEMKERKDINDLLGTESDPPQAQLVCDTKKDLASSPEKLSMPVKRKENPFAKFAHAASVSVEGRAADSTRPSWQRHSSSTSTNKRPNSCVSNNRDKQNSNRSKKIHASSKDEKKKEKDFVKMKDIPPEEQIKIIRKWHSMADPLASLEDRRYQVLLAARLHARCQEPTVRKAVLKLREHFASLSEAKTITVGEMAKSDPEELAGHISSLQFFNVKAKQIVKAAQEIQSRHGGIVPEDEFSLLQITGIGKTFADLLAFVNKRETHERISAEAVPV